MRVSCDTLILEVTRRCNMCCDHCLRGDAMSMDMDDAMVDKIVDAVDGIGTVVFSGGEPTLNLAAIRHFFDKVERKYGYTPAFYIVTNGLANQLELATILLDAYSRREDGAEREIYGVAISRDMFHDYIPETDKNPLRALSFYRSDKERDDWDDRWVIRAGRAAEYDFGQERTLSPELVLETDPDDEDVVVDQLYVSCNGNIVGDCDLDYDTIDRSPACTIDTLANHLAGLKEKENPS